MIAWFAKNPVAANLLMLGIFMAGMLSFSSIPLETFPSRETNTVTISTAFRGATPQTAEDSITLRIEDAIANIEGIIEINSRSSEGQSTVIAEISEGYNARNILDDIKVRVDALNTLPNDAEKPIVSLNVRSPSVIHVVVQGDVDKKTLRETADQIRRGLLSKSEISNVELQGVADRQMNIEVSPQNLDYYNLTLEQIGRAIRNGARDISAGNIQTFNGDILVRSDQQAYTEREFAAIPILANNEGKPITLGQIASIDDGFDESSLVTTFNGVNAIMIQIKRVGKQSALEVVAQTRQHIDEIKPTLPSGISIGFWDDDSIYLKSRLNAVLNSALYGGILVILMLSLFLRPAVAFWVCLGIPVSFMGAFLLMPQIGVSFNVISLFAFILVIGIVVDDAIVTGENIYRKIKEGVDPLQASITGTQEIAVPVTFGILSTIVAFLPLMFLGTGIFSFIAAIIPAVVIPILLMSLVESKLVLPAHLRHIKPRNPDDGLSRLTKIQQGISQSLEKCVEKYYGPFLDICLSNKLISLTVFLSVSAVILAFILQGHLKFTPMPRIESQVVKMSLTMPESTGFETTDQHIQTITKHFQTLQKKYTDPVTGKSVIEDILASSGSSGRSVKSNIGSVQASIQVKEERVIDVAPTQIAREIRQLVGDIPGAQSLSVRSHLFGNKSPIDVQLSGADPNRMYQLILDIKEKLKTYPSVFDIQDNYSGGKEEFTLNLKPRASSLGFRLNDVAQQVRHSIFGFQAQRLQIGQDELRVMVRYPLEHRSSIEDLTRLLIRVPNSDKEVLLSEIATITPSESPSTLYRTNRRSIINVIADVDKQVANAALIREDLNAFLQQKKQSYPDIQYKFVGEAADIKETNNRLTIGLIVVLLAIYGLLAIPFKSYGQPLIVMSIIPFAVISAMFGHIITAQSLSFLSMYGMLALVGVVVNDSLVLVDYINKQRRKGVQLLQAVMTAGRVRFRPVILTSITTFVGLIPILLDTSQQAKFLKPMATSLGFGILFATIITLIIVPINYIIARQFKYLCFDFFQSLKEAVKGIWQAWLEYWNREDQKDSNNV